MTEYIISTKQDLVDVADAIRYQTGKSESMDLKEMAAEVRALVASGGSNEEILLALEALEAKINEISNVTPNWEQDDPTAPDYIAGRTHYIGRQSAIALEEGAYGVRNGSVDIYDIHHFQLHTTHRH